MTATALLAYAWAAVTTFVFVPAGALLAFTMESHSPISASTVAVAVLSGIVHGFALAFAASDLRTDSDAARTSVRRTGTHGAVHHAAMFVVPCIGLAFGSSAYDVTTIAALGIPCAIGLGVSLSLREAASPDGHA